MSEGGSSPPQFGKATIGFPGDQVAIGILTTLIAGPMCKTGFDGMHASASFSTQWWGSLSGLGLGLVIGLVGYSFHWWKRLLSDRARAWVRSDSIRWWIPIAIVLAIGCSLGPDAYRRAMLPMPSAPSATDIAAALAPLIRPAIPQSSGSAPPDVFSLIASLRAQLDAAKRDTSQIQRQLDDTKLELTDALKPPIAPDATPTWLNLDFDYSGAPKETRSTNLHWASWHPVIASYPAFTGLMGTTIGAPPLAENEMTLLFLSFDKPIKYKEILVKAPPGFPIWSVLQENDRVAIISIQGKVISASISIEVLR